MRGIISLILMIGFIVLGAYVGIWVLLVGGLIQLIEAIKNNFDTVPMVIGAVKVLCCGAGWLIVYVGMSIIQLVNYIFIFKK